MKFHIAASSNQFRLMSAASALLVASLVSVALHAAQRSGPPPELADVTGYDEMGNGGTGPDVIGFRTNMTPREVVEAIRKHQGLPYSQTFESTLAFQSVDFKPTAVDKGDFINFITAFNADQVAAIRAGETYEVVTLALTPVPGKGRVHGITRQLAFPQGKQPTKASLVQSLTEKYGAPFVQNDFIMMWSFDAQGKLLPAPAPGQATNERNLCVGYHIDSLAPTAVAVSTTASNGQMNWNLTQQPNTGLRYKTSAPYHRNAGARGWESACGAIVIRANLQPVGPLLSGLELRVAAPDLVPPAQAQAGALIDAARKADEAAKVGNASKNKPAL